MADAVIRPYAPTDRAAVRALACDTADRGQPVERFFDDREVVADILTCYYTEADPQHVWVAVENGTVIGYVFGTLNTRRAHRFMAWRVLPRAFCLSVAHGSLWSPQARRLGCAAVHTLMRGGWWRAVSLRAYPAHLHVNLRDGSRGRGIGRQLVARFMDQARTAVVPGVHVAVRADNAPACRLFEALGFRVLSRHPVVMCGDDDTFQVRETVIYGSTLSSGSPQ